MSTVPMIIVHEKARRLWRFRPLLRGSEDEVRKLSVADDVHSWLYKDDGQSAIVKTKGSIKAHFGEFVRGESIDDRHFMKRVEDRRHIPPTFSHGVWAISPRFNPQYRFFGLFAITDWFVILNKQSRDVLDESDARWHVEIDKSLQIWSRLFTDRHPWVADNLTEYVSSNAEKCDDRW